MMKTIKDIRFAFVLCAGLLFLASPSVLEGKEAVVSNGVRDSGQIDKNTVDRETLVNKRFEFSWTSQEGGGVNGIATLKEDGSIEGIASPNETAWLIDASGRLLFKHADGRVSTRYDKVRLGDGLLCFEGPFLFREGITHHLTEVEGPAPEPTNEITLDQAARIKYSTQRFYHNYGVDFAGYEGRQKVISCIDGVVILVDHDQGSLSIRDDRGFVFYYGHLDSILSGIEVGSPVKKGQWVGMLGKRGASGNFSHLHVGGYLSESAMAADRSSRNLNLYPWLVAAYWKDGRSGLYSVARPHKTALTGDKVLFDGSNSMSFKSNITLFKWEFHDGASADGPMAEKVYDKPGCYIAALWVKDDRGAVDVDFCKVKVYSRSAPEGVIPTLFVTYYPSREVHADEPVNFRLWPQGMDVENIRIG